MTRRHKMRLLMVLAVAGLVAPVFGDLGVNWYNTTYMALDDTNNPADYPTIPAYGQMYWSTSGTPWAPHAGGKWMCIISEVVRAFRVDAVERSGI